MFLKQKRMGNANVTINEIIKQKKRKKLNEREKKTREKKVRIRKIDRKKKCESLKKCSQFLSARIQL